MDNTTLKAENLKPIFLKAGVPLAVSLAGLIYAWIMTKKSLSKVSSFSEIESHTPEFNSHEGTKHEENFNNFSSMEEEENYDDVTSIDNSVLSESLMINENHPCLEQEITCLRSKIEGMQIRELALTLQFEKYCEMKDQETLLMEIKNMLSMEMSRVEFFNKEISFLETETMRLENFVIQYLRIVEKFEYWKSENKVLHKKVQKLGKKSKAQSQLIKEKNLMIKEGEEEILRNHDELQKRASVILKLENEIREMKRVFDHFYDEKNELVKKLETAEENANACREKLHKKPLKYYLQVETEDVKKEDYSKVLNELEQVKKEHETEFEELIHLRKINGQDCSFSEHYNVPCIGSVSHGDLACSKKRKLLKRIKKWVVDGSEKARVNSEAKSSSDEIKCFGLHSVSHGSEKAEVPATSRFCASA
ncbi:protein CHUP1, chloroplastic [Cicer arietinum]|uniref:Uncharacterized protein LOC101499785 n=1 Tax=Cicer arietinum TaxID=3827 RepID=A0A1S2Y2R7_CICAR|nr:uncharacterized protein LOC101499785 [Cicer arietinum]